MSHVTCQRTSIDVSCAIVGRKGPEVNLDTFISRSALRPLIPGLPEQHVNASFRASYHVARL